MYKIFPMKPPYPGYINLPFPMQPTWGFFALGLDILKLLCSGGKSWLNGQIFLFPSRWNFRAAEKAIFMESGPVIVLQNVLCYQESMGRTYEMEGFLLPYCKTAMWNESYAFWCTFVLGGLQVSVILGYVPDYLCLWAMRKEDYLL